MQKEKNKKYNKRLIITLIIFVSIVSIYFFNKDLTSFVNKDVFLAATSASQGATCGETKNTCASGTASGLKQSTVKFDVKVPVSNRVGETKTVIQKWEKYLWTWNCTKGSSSNFKGSSVSCTSPRNIINGNNSSMLEKCVSGILGGVNVTNMTCLTNCSYPIQEVKPKDPQSCKDVFGNGIWSFELKFYF